ncbi:hypothetical protein [Zavarzinia sp.]|uniref:hypothetical protein n=1 Tax=Zavarzinia sp. TaxID=2027920 RepID=UPI00356179A9
MPARLAAAFLALLVLMSPPARAATFEDPDEVYAALAAPADAVLTIGGGNIAVSFAEGAPGLDRDLALAWIRDAATAVTTYFGRFPVARVGILVVAGDGAGVSGGTTWGHAGSAIRVVVGPGTDAAGFRRDWVMVHEMTHLALPRLAERHLWIQEGSAVYVEPLARAQAGFLDQAGAWRDSFHGMPKGEPGPDDRGLDLTHTWGRTYWGGATFCLLADIAIRQETGNAKGLQDAFRAINRASGGNGAFWTMERLIETGDAATGTHVLARLYGEMADRPVATDLPALFTALGIAEQGGHLTFDDEAPLARLRASLIMPERPAL